MWRYRSFSLLRSVAPCPARPGLRRASAVLLTLFIMLGLGTVPAPAQFFGLPFGENPQSPPPPRAHPQTAPPRASKVEPQPDTTPPDVTTPYDPDLQRLAEILGALHFLRGICGYDEGQKWRDEAQALIAAETPAGKRHDDMVESFNRGYLGFQQSYRTCTPAARIVIRRYLEEGAKIARDVTARYAN
jgi:uncharacterized protein (TIGR02301 family)